MLAKWLVKLSVCVLLGGCADNAYNVFEAKPGEAEWSPTITTEPIVRSDTTTLGDGSLLANSSLLNMFQDRRAYKVGDILTVILEEQTQSSKRANSGIKKNSKSGGNYNYANNLSSIDATGSFSLGADRSFNGGGSSSQQNALSGAITVTVAEILPTGALRIRGEKWIKLNQGDEYIRLTGLVRVEDIDKSNRISSRRLADANITYAGRGELAESNQQGWFTRFINSKWFPF